MVEQFHNPNSFICFTTHQMKHFYSPALRSQELGFRVRGKEMITWILLSNLISKMDVALRTCSIKGRPFQKILGRWLNEPSVYKCLLQDPHDSTNQINSRRALNETFIYSSFVVFQWTALLSLFFTPEPQSSLPVVPHRILTGPNNCVFEHKRIT